MLPHEFTSTTNTNFERASFLTGTENRHIYEFTSPKIKKTPESTNAQYTYLAPTNLNDTTVCKELIQSL